MTSACVNGLKFPLHPPLQVASSLSLAFQDALSSTVPSLQVIVAGHNGGRKLKCIDGINTTIYYKKNSHSD